MRVFSLRPNFVARGAVVQPRQFLVCFERLGERELVDPGVGAHRGIERGSQPRALDKTELTDAGVDARHGIERGSQSRVLDKAELTNQGINARRGIR